MYHQPQAFIREGGSVSDCFHLGRGTRKGCPLSLLLFVLARKPLAARIRAHGSIVGLKYGTIQEKILLYADNILLLLGDADISLRTVMSIIMNFSRFSGLTINWSKSALLPLDQGVHSQLDNYCSVPIVTSFKYLGVVISPQPLDFCRLNIPPLLIKFMDKVKI